MLQQHKDSSVTYKGDDTFRVAICGSEPGSEEMEAAWAGQKKTS